MINYRKKVRQLKSSQVLEYEPSSLVEFSEAEDVDWGGASGPQYCLISLLFPCPH